MSRLRTHARWETALQLFGLVLLSVSATGAFAPGRALATFSGINGKLAYESVADSGLPALSSFPVGGSPTDASREPGDNPNPTPAQLVGGPGVSRDAHWSPDASHIAFTSTRTGNPEIFTLNLKDPTATPRQLTFDPALDSDPSWSADGALIAFTSTRGGDPDIWVMNAADGSGAHPLTSGPAVDQQAEFSPTDDRIVFESNRTGSQQLFVMRGDGSAATQLTNSAGIAADANWRPSGDQIAFTTGPIQRTNVAVVPAAGGTPRLLTNDGLGDQFPAWSPDGRQIAFDRFRFGRGTIKVIDAPDATGAGAPGPARDVTPASGEPLEGVDADWGDLQPVEPAPPEKPAVAMTASPEVLVKPPGAESAKPLARALRSNPGQRTREVPLGTKIDATTPDGRPLDVKLAASLGRGHGVATARATGGTYVMRREIEQRRAALDLHLTPSSRCRRRGGASASGGPVAFAARPIDFVRIRRGRGHVSTSSGYSTAAGHHTAWLMTVTCRATVTIVEEGIVRVTSRGHKPISLHAGEVHVTRRP